jgi:hypothetical protein
MTLLSLTLLALTFTPPGDDPGPRPSGPSPPDWHFVLPAPGDPFEHAPFRALVLSREKPEDLVEKASYRGDPARRRYAQIRFGSPGSVRVTVVLDEAAPGDVDLYVDAGRNRKIDDRDLVQPSSEASAGAEHSSSPGAAPRRERVWRLPLDVSMVDKDLARTIPRAVIFRLGASGRTLGYAGAGYLDGTIGLGPDTKDQNPNRNRARTLAARRVDGDGNGLLTDSQDRLWIDLNGDGRFDPTSEQFLFTTLLNLEGSRYVIRSDELGNRLTIEPLIGAGTLRLALKKKGAAAGTGSQSETNGVEMHATALGRDGSVYGLSGHEPATVPVGEYRLGTVTIAYDDPQGGQRWSFIFSDNGAKGDFRWYQVEKEGAISIDPIGTPSFELSLRDNPGAIASPGAEVDLQPLLYTGDGLLINVGYRGAPVSPALQELLGARLTLETTAGSVLATAHSGFS